jgi:uncharacterized paraquat-inducible protein A
MAAHPGGCRDCQCLITEIELNEKDIGDGDNCSECQHTFGRHSNGTSSIEMHSVKTILIVVQYVFGVL